MPSFTIETNIFCEAIASIIPVIPNKPSRDILKAIKISVKSNDTLELQATDLEIFSSLIIDSGVAVSDAGEFIVPAEALYDYVKSIEDEHISVMETDTETIRITEESAVFEVGTLDIDEFPRFPELSDDADDWATLSIDEFTTALNKVLFAVAEKGHPRWGALSAVSIEINNNQIVLIGTDQHRASVVTLETDTHVSDKSILVAGKALALIPKVFSGNIKMSLHNDNTVIFTSNGSVLFIRLVQGNFPQVKNFIPDNPYSLTFPPQELLKLVKKAALAIDPTNTLKIELTDKVMTLTAKQTRQQHRAANVKYDVHYDGNPIKFAVNCKYLMDILKATSNGEDLEIKLNQAKHPVLFKQDSFVHLLVPLEVR